MAFNTSIITSIFGRRLGLQAMTTNQTGASAGRRMEFLVGPDEMRVELSTAETTSVNLKPYGVSWVGTVAATSSVYVIDPPIPGIMKTVVFTSAYTPVYLRTMNGPLETFRTTADSTIATVISSTLTGATVQLIGLTTSMWGLLTNGTSAITRAATT